MTEDKGWFLVLLAVGGIAYGLFGLWNGGIHIPGRGSVTLHGVAMWVFFSAIVCWAASVIFFVVDEFFDVRLATGINNRVASEAAFLTGTVLYVVSLVTHVAH